MEAGCLGTVADLDLGVWQFPELLNRLHIGGAHIGGGNNPELAAALGKLLKLVHQKPQTAPLDEGHQHINAVSGSNLFLEFSIQLRPWVAPVNKELCAMELSGLPGFQKARWSSGY